jgi:hypothetical protein
MTISYATLNQLKVEGANIEPGDATKLETYNSNLVQYGIRASGVIDRLKNTTFAPLVDTRYIDAFGDNALSSYRLLLNDALMELTSVTLADGTALVVNTDVRSEPRGVSPKRWLQMITSANTFQVTSGEVTNDVVVVGAWGWHSDYDNAWLDSGDTVQNATGIDASQTTITVTAANGVGGDGFAPRFSPGNLIQIESEWCTIVKVSTDNLTLTVLRGQRGTTGAIHAKETAISVFFADDAICRAAANLAVFMYGSRGKTNQVSFETIRTNPNNVQALADVLTILDNYQFMKFVGA